MKVFLIFCEAAVGQGICFLNNRVGFFSFILFFKTSFVFGALGDVVSGVVGRVGDYYLTSREVQAVRLIEIQLYPTKSLNFSAKMKSPEFVNQVTSAILEKVVAVEAENFSIANVSTSEIDEAVKKLKKGMATNKAWLHLHLAASEIEEFVIRKIRSKKFLKYKSDAANLTVTHFEVKDYFEKNKNKFGNMPLESFQENIKNYLGQKQMEDRLREWFESLRKKYQVRNFLVEA